MCRKTSSLGKESFSLIRGRDASPLFCSAFTTTSPLFLLNLMLQTIHFQMAEETGEIPESEKTPVTVVTGFLVSVLSDFTLFCSAN